MEPQSGGYARYPDRGHPYQDRGQTGGGYGSAPHRTPVKAHNRPEAPKLKFLKQKGRYQVQKPWRLDLNGKTWHIPAGYRSNGLTVPAQLKKTMGDSPDAPETWAAVFHDWLFKQPGISRAEADKLFYDALIAYGVSQRKADLMYTSVRAYSLTKKFR